MKIVLTTTFIIWSLACGMFGYIWYDAMHDVALSGVRGGERTGFQVKDGDNITIGTSSPTLADIHVYRTSATSSIAITGNKHACLAILDTDGTIQYYISQNKELATTTQANCGL